MKNAKILLPTFNSRPCTCINHLKNQKIMKKINLLILLILLTVSLNYAQIHSACNCKEVSAEQIQRKVEEYQPSITVNNLSEPENFNSSYIKKNKTNKDRDGIKSNLGVLFWLTFMPQFTPSQYIDLTSTVNTSGTLSIPGISFIENFNITANTIVRINIPLSATIKNANSIQNLGIKIVSNDPIAVYASSIASGSSDSYLGIPVESTGLNYLITSYLGVNSDYPSEFAIVGSSDGTSVDITPSVRC